MFRFSHLRAKSGKHRRTSKVQLTAGAENLVHLKSKNAVNNEYLIDVFISELQQWSKSFVDPSVIYL